jgi:hypothetical protein
LIPVLDGSLDFYDKFEEMKHAEQVANSGSNDPYQPLLKKAQDH